MIEVVGTAEDPIFARDKIKELKPDVLTLDIEMPRMDGITFLKNLMRLRPMPVIMISTFTEAGADITLQALEIGAVDFIAKPKINITEQLNSYSRDIIEKVKIAAIAKITPSIERSALSHNPVINRASMNHASSSIKTATKIIALGSSTGGTEAIKDVLIRMPSDAPAIVIASIYQEHLVLHLLNV